MHSSHQAFGLLWHGDLKGTWGIPDTVEGMEFASEDLNATWLFVYNWDFSIFQDSSRMDYIQNNFELRQIGFLMQEQQQIQPVYFLFKKGGSFNISEIDSTLANSSVNIKEYEYTFGKQQMYYIDVK